ncbi:MAG: glutamyl-tRNA reductase [Pseudomonadota bacterium]
MSAITLIGVNHKTAPVELRETLAFNREETAIFLKTLQARDEIREAMLFSTCNRTEILFVPDNDLADFVVKELLADFKGVPVTRFENALYTHSNDAAVHHLFRVASSLDSMIVGEPQILGQVKEAYRTTVASHTSGVILNRLLHKAFSIAKRVRRETGIGDNAVSISYAAIELASKIFSDLATRSVLLLGAGDMAEIAVEHLISHGVKSITVANRTFSKAVTLAERFQGRAVKFEERETMLSDVDIIISSTGATGHVLTAAQVRQALKYRKNKPLFFIDIAVPRDIDPEVNKLGNAYLYDIDDLQDIVNDNLKERSREAVKGERLVEEAVIKFRKWLDTLELVPTIIGIKEKITAITEQETEKTLSGLKHLSPQDMDAIRRMSQAITNKVIHDPIRFLKNTGEHRDDSRYINVARHLFNLDNINDD